jgi:hypothetical protein
MTSVVGSKTIDVLCYNATSMRIVLPNHLLRPLAGGAGAPSARSRLAWFVRRHRKHEAR